MKNLFCWLLAHSLSLVCGFILFVILFQTPLAAGLQVFFYRGCALIVVAALLNAALMALWQRFLPRGVVLARDVALSAVVVMSLNLVFFTHLPVTADRSVTVFLLGHMADGQARTPKEVRDFFVARYVDDYGAMQRRFDEQIVSGNMVRDGETYRITAQGQSLLRFYDWMTDVFQIDKRFVQPNNNSQQSAITPAQAP